MNTEIANELINRAKAMANTPELKDLVADLETFMAIAAQGQESDELKSKWLAARSKLWTSFDKLTALYGVSPELIKELMENFPAEYQDTVGLINKGLTEAPKKISLDKTLKARI